ncbi:MAG: FtsK/SpoIIIE domain-containing protein [Terracoccus sp.]
MGRTTLELRRTDASPQQLLEPARTPTLPRPAGDGFVTVRPRDRRPRRDPAETVTFPGPPHDGARTGETPHPPPLLAVVAPLVLSVVLAVVLRSPTLLLLGLLSPLLVLGQWWGDRRHGTRTGRRHRSRQRSATVAAERSLEAALRREQLARRRDHADLALLEVRVRARHPDIWARRPGDPDHLRIAWGSGDQPARVLVTDRGDHPPPVCRDVPLVWDAAAEPVLGVVGDRTDVLALVGAVTVRACSWHAPADLSVVVVTHGDTLDDWGWATYLPHLCGEDLGHPALASLDEPDRVSTLLADLAAPPGPGDPTQPGPTARPTTGPTVLVVLDLATSPSGHPDVDALLRAGPSARVALVVTAASAAELPRRCSRVIATGDGPATPDLPTRGWLESVARSLAPLRDPDRAQGVGTLPASLGLAAAHRAVGLDPLSVAGVVHAWRTAPPGPTAVLGRSGGGPLQVDLTRDGPHVLVGGTTGAGKSELLQTLVAGLALSTPPTRLCFILVDYKGGAAFHRCAQLPHTVGLVTDLDEHLTVRALTSLQAEIRRREGLLAGVGATDVDAYEQRRPSGSPVLPRIVIVVDEFRQLADELPDFVRGLVRIAAVGRSLGIHLVLATQRPAGIVSADMRANIALRIALRVRDRADSDDVIDAPDAATISDRAPGRCWVRTAGQRLIEVQTAYAGLPVAPEGRPPAPVTVREFSDAGDIPGASSGAPPAPGTSTSELETFVVSARAAAESLGLAAAPAPWLPALPDALPLAGLDVLTDRLTDRDTCVDRPGPADAVLLGLLDLPGEQRQDLALWSPTQDGNLGVTGDPRSGRTTTLRTVAAGLARLAPSDVHLQVLEGEPGSLSDLAGLPHTGTVVSTADPDLVRATVQRLAREVAARTGGAGGSDRRGPVTVVLVDGWEQVEESLDGTGLGASADLLLGLMRDGPSRGVRFVVAGGRALLSGRLAAVLPRRILLPVADPVARSLAGLPATGSFSRSTPGRGRELPAGTELQVAHTGATPAPADQRAAVREAARRATERHRGRGPVPWQVRALPTRVGAEALRRRPGLLAVGVGGDDGATVGFDTARGVRAVLVAGRRRTGRSTALATIALELLGAGRDVAVIAPPRSPLRDLAPQHGLTVLGPTDVEAFVGLRRARPDLSVVVDDAETVEGSALEAVLVEVAHRLVDTDGSLAVAADLARCAAVYRGLVAETARGGSGLVLCPTAAADGDLFAVRLDVPPRHHPGRGVVVEDGVALPVQVAVAGDRPRDPVVRR